MTKDENKIVLYSDKKGNIELHADIKKDTLWATQEQIANIFDTSKQTISWHMSNIFKQGELRKKAVVKDSLTTARDGKQYLTIFYNLDAIIAVGYRVNSKKATQFRVWATKILRDYLVNGYSLNTHQLRKAPQKIEGLDEAIRLLESNQNPGPVKGKIIFKLTKNMM